MTRHRPNKLVLSLKGHVKKFISNPTHVRYLQIVQHCMTYHWPCEHIKSLSSEPCTGCPIRHNFANEFNVKAWKITSWCTLAEFVPFNDKKIFNQYQGEVLLLMIKLLAILENQQEQDAS